VSGNRRLAENIAALSVVQFLNYVAPLITIPYLVRILHPAQFGLLSFSQGIVLCFSVITDWRRINGLTVGQIKPPNCLDPLNVDR
jgi:PST family polysaccharide transporter